MNEEDARKLFAGPCDFVWGATSAENLPPEKLNEVAFVGRSNAGKSSLVNALTGRKSLARVSQTPGATRQINFFNLADRLMLVDLPGYGFAKRSKTEAEAWQEMIFSYLRRRARLRRVALLIDARRGVMDTDLAVMELLDRAGKKTQDARRRFIEIKPKLDFGQLFPTETPIAAFRATVARLHLEPAQGERVPFDE